MQLQTHRPKRTEAVATGYIPVLDSFVAKTDIARVLTYSMHNDIENNKFKFLHLSLPYISDPEIER